MATQPANRPMTPRTADPLKIIVWFATHTPHNCRHFLASLRLYALDEIGASLLVEERIFPVVSRPHSASSGIDKFMRAANNRARCQYGHDRNSTPLNSSH